MSTAVQHAPLVSPVDYFAGEVATACKHEYLNGVVYAMAGATQRHNDLAGNILGILHAKLRGNPRRPYGSDMLVQVKQSDDLRFYYPDVTIICRPAGPSARVQTEPNVIFEVLSESTARTDTGEKRLAYLTIPTLEAYVLVDSDRREVTIWRRKEGLWAPEMLKASDAVMEFTSAGCGLSVGEIYENSGL